MNLFKSKKAMMDGMPKIVNLLFGLILIAAGGLGLFGEQIGFVLPDLPMFIFSAIAAIGGLIMILDGFMGSGMSGIMPKNVNLGIGFLIFISGLALVLQKFDIVPIFEVPFIIIQIILIVGGIVLFLDGILGANSMSM
jgi:hypothetical protein